MTYHVWQGELGWCAWVLSCVLGKMTTDKSIVMSMVITEHT